jgi:alkylation response protein AidB-like acyl-CoA dehydrogenase
MDFAHTEDRRMLADSLGRYVAEQYPFDTRQQIARSVEGFSREQWRQFADLGVIGALFNEADGGLGGTGFDIAVVFEELGRGLVVEPFLASAMLAGSALSLAGNDAQKALLSGIQDGSLVATLAHDEPQSHYALAHVNTQATGHAAGWTLNGHKAVVPHAAQAQVLIVSARTSGQTADEHGISLFIVPANTPGLLIRPYPTIDGGHAAEVLLNQVALPPESLLGTLDQALPTLEHAVGRGLLALCAESLGAMEAAKLATIEYLQTRKQFGKPIGSFQALQHRMATLLLEIEQARSAVINAAAALDADRLTRERALSAAKYSIGRIGILVAEECIQLHGGIGMTWELPLAHYAKRLVMIDHQLGDEDHHLARFIALGQH